MSTALEIAGPSLTLRYPREDDAEALLELASDAQVTRFFSWGPYRDVSEPRAYIAGLEARREAGELLDFLIVHRERGPLGITGLSDLGRRDRRAIVGTWLGRPFWGTGANAESKAMLASLGFTRLGMDRLGAYTSTENPRSQAALERLGFVREGTLRGFHRHGEQVHDVVIFGLLRRDWEGSALSEVRVKVSGQPPEAFVVA